MAEILNIRRNRNSYEMRYENAFFGIASGLPVKSPLESFGFGKLFCISSAFLKKALHFHSARDAFHLVALFF